MTLIDSDMTIRVDFDHDAPSKAIYIVNIPVNGDKNILFHVTELDMLAIIHVFSHALYEKNKATVEIEEAKIKKKQLKKESKRKKKEEEQGKSK